MIESYYSTGANTTVAADILGDYWLSVFRQRGLVNGVATGQGMALSGGETDERGLLAWLDETAGDPGLGAVNRVALVPLENIQRLVATLSDGLVMGGSGVYMGQPSTTVAWTVDLPFPLLRCPKVAVSPDSGILLEGVDYTVQSGSRLLFHTDPSGLGFRPALLMDTDGDPVWACRIFLLDCIPLGAPGYDDRWGFYKCPETARRAVFDLLVGEASSSRILAAVEASTGVVAPTVFDQIDDTGPFTWILREDREGDHVVLPTSGGEAAIVPLAIHETHYGDQPWKYRPGQPLTSVVTFVNRLSDSDIPVYRLSTGDYRSVLVPNAELTVGTDAPDTDAGGGTLGPHTGFNLQVRGWPSETADFYSRLEAGLEAAGTTMGEVFQEGDHNPMELLFDATGRRQPSVVKVDAGLLGRSWDLGDVGRAIADTLPAGGSVMLSLAASVEESPAFAIAETLEAFIVCTADEDFSPALQDDTFSRRAI